jgi:N-acetylmuramoyl-L-alanine amidase
VRGYNARSIGIELVNLGRYPDWFDSRCQQMKEPYPQAQIDALVTLLQELGRILPALRWIAGHEVLDASKVAATDTSGQLISRKRDPGPLFPWSRVLAAIGLQYLQGEALDGYQPD